MLTPRTLDEALRLRAETGGAWPIQGGTDVMVELNFDRARPAALLNLNEVAELRGVVREDGTLRLGAGLTYSECRRELGELVAAGHGQASREIRHSATISRGN